MKFLKQILRPGKFLVNGLDGKRRVETFTPERIKGFEKTFSEMIKDQMLIPGPWYHDQSAPEKKDKLQAHPDSSKNNAGYWEKVFVDKDGSLMGILDVPVASDAEKVGQSVREVSPTIKPAWTDGDGKVWNDALTHIALVTHPVQKGQTNFKPLDPKSNEYSVAMSLFLGPESLTLPENVDGEQLAIQLGLSPIQLGPVEKEEEKAPGSFPSDNQSKEDKEGQSAQGVGSAAHLGTTTIKDALKILRKIGLDLPDDTSDTNMLERICVAGRAIVAKEKQDAGPGAGTKVVEQPNPIAMSLTPGVNSSQSTNGSGGSSSNSGIQMSASPEAIVKFATDQAKKSLASRIENLVKSGRTTPAYKKKHLDPLLTGFQLSLDDSGQAVPSELDRLLEALEAAPAHSLTGRPLTGNNGRQATGSQLSRGVVEDLPEDLEGIELATDGEDLDAAVNLQLRNVGWPTQNPSNGRIAGQAQ